MENIKNESISIKESSEESKVKKVKALVNIGMPANEIADMLGISIKEIEKLLFEK